MEHKRRKIVQHGLHQVNETTLISQKDVIKTAVSN